MRKSSTPRKILYCESNVDGTIGGSHYCLLWLVENLDRAAFEPLVVFYESHALVPRFQQVAATLILPKPNPVTWGAGASGLVTLPMQLIRRSVNAALFLGRVFRYCAFLRRHEIALVHQNNSVKRHHDWMLAAKLVGVPCVAHERGINDFYSWSDRKLASGLAQIVPASKSIMGFMIAGGVRPANIRVLYDGLDPTRVKPARTPDTLRQDYRLRADQQVIGIVGNIRQWKGQAIVVRALIEVLKVHPDVVCFFVGASTSGDKAYQDELDAEIARAGIGANVRFTGYQSDPASFVNLMAVVVHASVAPEPFGMVVLEAMAQRKPVIGSRAGGVVEMVVEGKTGYTFPPGDHVELARRLIELLGNPSLAAQMGNAGHQRLLDSFTIEGYMTGIHAVYRSILDNSPLPPNVGIPAATGTA